MMVHVGRPRSARTTGFTIRCCPSNRHTARNVSRCSPLALEQAFLESYPLTMAPDVPTHRSIARFLSGLLVEVFALDMRSYRSANNDNLQSAAGADTRTCSAPARCAG